MRKAGELLKSLGMFVRNKDDAYAQKWRETVGGPEGSNPIRQLVGAMTGSPLTHGLTTFDDGTGVMRPASTFSQRAVAYGMPVASMTARYALPAAGAVALAKATGGLFDLASNTQVIPQDQTNQLPY